MTPGTEIAVPLWLLTLLVCLAAWAIAARVVLPLWRGYVRRQDERVLEELGGTQKLRIEPFRLTRRYVLVDRLVTDPEVEAAVEETARAEGRPREEVAARVRGFAKEILPAFHAYFYFRVGYALARAVARRLYRVRLAYADTNGLAAIPPKSTVVFVMNHRSNMDYILVSFLVAERTALSYAVGEWARIWPIEQLIRSTGAYFVRRNSKDPLYRKVLERYVAMATASGVTQAVFPEGRLSRDGRLQPPRLGLLDYMLRSFDPEGERDVVFIPVGVNYDRTLEDRTLLLDLDAAAPRARGPAAVMKTLAFVLRNVALMVRNEWHRFGYACASFGTPVSLKAFLEARLWRRDLATVPKEERIRRVAALAEALMADVAALVPVLPVSLVATLFTREPGRAFSLLELKAEALAFLGELAARGAHLYLPRGDQDYAIEVGLRMLTLRRIVRPENGLYRAAPEELSLLRYYAGSLEPAGPAPPAA
jgi:glycerol-3-phosphate O-acyltransferase